VIWHVASGSIRHKAGRENLGLLRLPKPLYSGYKGRYRDHRVVKLFLKGSGLIINNYSTSPDYYMVSLGFEYSVVLFYLGESNNKIIRR
jgi:hypothetical protein